MSLLAYEEAASHYEQALQVLELQEPPDEGQRCELLIARADAQIKGGESAEAVETAEAALELARKVHPPELLAKAALAYEYARFAAGTTFADGSCESTTSLSVGPTGEATTSLSGRDSAANSTASSMVKSAVSGGFASMVCQ